MYSSENYAFLFDQPHLNTNSSSCENVALYRTKTINCGENLECDILPMWATRNEVRKAREHATREAQQTANANNARRHLCQLIENNFTSADLCVGLDYAGVPPDEKQALRDMQNYIRRVRAYRRKHDLGELKYVYVIEYQTDPSRPLKRIHHHVIMSGMDRDESERLWLRGRANSRRLQPDDYGLTALSIYVVKDPQGRKRWRASKNLKPPRVTRSDTKLSKRRVKKLEEDMETNAPAIFSKLFPEYNFNDCRIRHSPYVPGAYIYVRMRKAPQWADLKDGHMLLSGFKVRHEGQVWLCWEDHFKTSRATPCDRSRAWRRVGANERTNQ